MRGNLTDVEAGGTMEFDEEGREGWGCDGDGEGEKRVCLRRLYGL